MRDPPAPASARDLEILELAAQHRFVLAEHVAALYGVSLPTARRRLRALAGAGQLSWQKPLAVGRCYQITRPGLRRLGSSLPRPRELDLGGFDHDLGLAWLWLAARRGAFGQVREIVSERRMRSEDAGRGPLERPHAVRLPGAGPHGGDRLHYPDLLLHTASGHRVAIELELTGKSRARRREILGGYAFDSRIDAVLYLVESPRAAEALERSAREAGIAGMVHVKSVRFGPGSGAIGRDRAARTARALPAPARTARALPAPARTTRPAGSRRIEGPAR